MLTLDGSAAGDATFNNQVIVGDGKLVLGSTAVTSTAAELNLLDNVSGLVQADLTKLAAVDSTAAELNLLNGVSGLVQADLTKLAAVDSTAAELNILDDATVTTAELNLIDGGTARGTTAVATGDGILINDGGTMRMTNVDTVSTYFAGHNVGGGNIVTTGALDSGSITSGFGAIDNGTSNIRSATITAETAFVPDAANGATLGTASLEFADMYLHDGGIVYFGADQDVELAHVADVGLTLKTATTSDDTKATLTLQTGDTDIAANDVLGQLHFQAPDEGAGTDAILVAAGIAAISEGNFSASNNATKLSFQTGASEAAAEKMSLSSGGDLTVSGNADIKGGAIFNEDSADKDFRVESNGNTHMLFVDGGTDRVGVGIAAPVAQLTVGSNDSGGQGATGKTALFSGTNTSVYNDGNNGTFGGITISNNDSTSNNTSAGVNLVHGTGGVASIQSTSAASATADLRFGVRGTQDSGNTVEAMKIDSEGHVTKSFQPAVHAVPNATQNDMANGIVKIVLGAEVYDTNSDFNVSNSTFTAPVGGKYLVACSVDLTDIDTASQFLYGNLLISSNRNYYMNASDPRVEAGSDYAKSFAASAIVDMDANDTLTLNVRSSSHGAAQMNVVYGGGETFLTIALLH